MKTTLKMKMNSKIKTTSKVKTTENLKIRNICLPLQMFSVQHPLKKIVSHTKMENDLQFNWTQWTPQLLFGYRTCFRKIDTIEINLVCNHSHSFYLNKVTDAKVVTWTIKWNVNKINWLRIWLSAEGHWRFVQ